MTNAYSPASMASAAAQPNKRLFTSASVGWQSILLEHHASTDESGVYDVFPTEDQTIVMALEEHELDIKRGGRWRSTIMRSGSFGTTLPHEGHQLRWRARGNGETFHTAHLYLPWAGFAEAIDYYRLAGQSAKTDQLSRLSTSDPVVQNVVGSLLTAMREGVGELYAQSAREWLVVHMLSTTGTIDPERIETSGYVEPTDRRLKRAIEAMTEGLSGELSLDALAAEANMSKFHFLRAFRNATKMTPFQYVTELRMAAARRLLTTTDLPIGEIGRRCGYNRPNNFTTAFTKFFASSPRDVRRASIHTNYSAGGISGAH